jgi:NAD-dependent dihydropyrimidine dehydrogenase PreA subunit
MDMAKRKIVTIDEEKCNGCGLCIPNCAEGALQIIDGKARLVHDRFCDGLGACLGHCPQDAITVAEREADEFDEKAVELHLHKKKEHDAKPKVEPLFAGCPSSRPMHFKTPESVTPSSASLSSPSMLSHWPVQLKLVPVHAPYFENADLLVVADCVPLAYANFHRDFLKGRAVVVGCPKLDDVQGYKEKLTDIFKTNAIKSVTLPYMEVPCCFGLVKATEDAVKASGKDIPINKIKIGVRGQVQSEDSGQRGIRIHGRG